MATALLAVAAAAGCGGQGVRVADHGRPDQRSTPEAAAATTGRTGHGLIVFEHDDKNMNSHIWAMDTDGANPRPLTRGGRGYVDDQEPTVSPDGRRIAFLRITGLCRATCAHEGIWVMDRSGQHQHKIASGNLVWRAWSPTGTKIAVLRPMAGGQRSEIEVMDADGSHLRVLPNHGFGQLSQPSWSSNGRRLVFTALQPGAHGDDLYTEQVDGTHLVRLTHSPGFKASPSWSPSDAQIVFQHARHGAGPWHLVVVHSDGTHPRQITTGVVSAQFPHFDSTGRSILYQHGIKTSRAYVVRPDGTGNRPVSRTTEASEPTWKPVSAAAHPGGTSWTSARRGRA